MNMPIYLRRYIIDQLVKEKNPDEN